jgi:hypothetical protein
MHPLYYVDCLWLNCTTRPTKMHMITAAKKFEDIENLKLFGIRKNRQTTEAI